MREAILVASNVSGRFALDLPDGRDITSGDIIAIRLGGQWIEGRVEHGRERYPNTGLQFLVNERQPRVLDGYYFIADDGGFCGLCIGMKVQIF